MYSEYLRQAAERGLLGALGLGSRPDITPLQGVEGSSLIPPSNGGTGLDWRSLRLDGVSKPALAAIQGSSAMIYLGKPEEGKSSRS